MMFSHLVFAFLILSPGAFAQSLLMETRFTSPHGIEELCYAPQSLNIENVFSQVGSPYLWLSASQNKVLEKLCGVNFYDARESTEAEKATVICPKVGSSNPSLMLLELPVGISRADFIKNECPKGKRGSGELIAKFKQSISCSYTPSILGYPRFGQMLKSEIEFPYTIYRSMDLSEHLEMAKNAISVVEKATGHDSLISQTWRTLYWSDVNPKRYGNVLYRDNYAQIYGALVPNLKNDEIYYAANGSTEGDRISNFQKTYAFARIASPKSVASFGLAKTFTLETVQALTLLREMGDQIILDTLLNQADRLGNLHYRDYYVKMNSDGSYSWVHLKHMKDEKGKSVVNPFQAAEMNEQGYVLIKRMLLADNDCGITKANVFKNAGVAQKIAHLHPDTYRAIQVMNRLAEQGKLASYLKTELLFTDRDVASVQANLKAMAETFKKKCLLGTLYQDADLAQYLGLKPAVALGAGCEI